MIAVAENLASTPIVRDRYADPFAAQPLAPDVDRAIALSGAQLVDLAGSDNVVRASSEPYPSVWQLLSGAGERLLVYLGLGAALELAASWILSRRIKRHTRGLEVAEIAGRADHRKRCCTASVRASSR